MWKANNRKSNRLKILIAPVWYINCITSTTAYRTRTPQHYLFQGEGIWAGIGLEELVKEKILLEMNTADCIAFNCQGKESPNRPQLAGEACV